MKPVPCFRPLLALIFASWLLLAQSAGAITLTRWDGSSEVGEVIGFNFGLVRLEDADGDVREFDLTEFDDTSTERVTQWSRQNPIWVNVRLRVDVPPAYTAKDISTIPELAGQTVRLRVVISDEGQMLAARVIGDLPLEAVAPLVEAMDRWTFTPGLIGGKPVKAELIVELKM